MHIWDAIEKDARHFADGLPLKISSSYKLTWVTNKCPTPARVTSHVQIFVIGGELRYGPSPSSYRPRA